MNRQNESLEAAFVPDILTPGQYYDLKRRDNSDDPLKRLMMAVLQDAIRCFQVGTHAKSGSKLLDFYEAREWLFGKTCEGPFSFQSVCEVLEIAPQYLRIGLAALQSHEVAGFRKPRLGRRGPVLGSGKIASLPKKISKRLEGPLNIRQQQRAPTG
jgi:hypothetical protein